MDEMIAARHAAQAIWQTWRASGGDDAPNAVPVRALIAAEGIEIAALPETDHAQTMGYLDPDDDLIWLKQDLVPTVERFTLAHEFGHFLLKHRGAAEEDEPQCGVADIAHSSTHDASAAMLRPDEAYSPRSRRESQANAFAAELLTPLEVVRALYLGAGHTAPLTTDQIATACQVSKAVIITQLTRLLALESDSTYPEVDDIAPTAPTPDLDASQRAAAEVPAPALIVAGPGTGKTSTLVARVRWLVAQGARPDQILAMTFSRKAAREMRERIGASLGAQPGEPLPLVTTFHRFGGDLLRSYGHLVGLRPDFRLVDQIGAFFALRDLARDLPLNYFASLASPTQHFGDLLGAISAAKDELVTPERYADLAQRMREVAATPEAVEAAERAAEVAAVYAAYQAELQRRGDADYGDLIMLAARLLAEQPEVADTLRARYPHVLVDEFQDINRANGILLRHLAGPQGAIWAVGDANQAIYRFRGASPANIANFQQDYPAARVVALAQNYRSRPAIVAAANAFAATELRQEGALELAPIAATRADLPESVRLLVAPDGPSEIAAIVADLRQRHDAGAAWRDHAVLCRTRALTRQFTEALARVGIPAETKTDLFENPAIKDLLGVAHLLAGETGGLLRAGHVADHAFGRTAALQALTVMRQDNLPLVAAIDALLEAGGLVAAESQGFAHLKQILGVMRHAPSIAQGLATYLLELTELGRRHIAAGGETAAHLAELLALAARCDEERPIPANADPDTQAAWRWREFVTYLRTVRTLQRETAREDTGDAAPDCVRVLTAHGAKGLEWPVVYLPRLASSYFPLPAKAEPIPPPPGLASWQALDAKAAQRGEEACLFYVALTRARDTLLLSRAEQYGKVRRSASDFLPAVIQVGNLEPRRAPRVAVVAPDVEEQLAALDDPAFALPDVLSSGALTTYDACPRQFAYRYGYHFAGRRGNWGRLRQAVTAALQDATQHTSDAERAVRIFDETWQAAQPEDEAEPDPFAELYARHGRQAVATAFAQVHHTGTEATSFARAVAVAVRDTLVRVEVDRVEGQPSAPDSRAVQHHLGRRRAMRDPDIPLYLAVLAQRQMTGDAFADTIYEHHLNSGEVRATKLKPKDEAKLRDKVADALRGISAADYPPRPDARRCAGCEFALICPA